MTTELILSGFGVALLPAMAYFAVRLDPSYIVSAGLGLSVFSGNWSSLGSPIGLDRIVIVAGIALAVYRRRQSGEPFPRSPIRLFIAMALLSFYAIGSALWSDTLFVKTSAFALLDQLGVIPFVLFAAAPLVFETERQRSVLVGTLTLVAAYLAELQFSRRRVPVAPFYLGTSTIRRSGSTTTALADRSWRPRRTVERSSRAAVLCSASGSGRTSGG